MKLMLGFRWQEAFDHAVTRGWAVNELRQRFTDTTGDTVVTLRGGNLGAVRDLIAGMDFDQIIQGPQPVADDIMALAHSRLRRR
jgi:hypothetical protein